MSRFFSDLSVTMAIRGVFAILFGVIALASPDITLATLLLLFGAFVLADGVIELAGVISNAQSLIPRWVLALDGLGGIAVGLVAIIFPGITSLALLYIIAAWALLTGGMLIGAAFAGPRFEPAWLMVLDGVIAVIFGLALVAWPGSGLLAIVWALGVFAIISGIALLIGAFRMRQIASSLSGSPH
jgi:uncharacterized membrane protein HdeD (DUF308 family)